MENKQDNFEISKEENDILIGALLKLRHVRSKMHDDSHKVIYDIFHMPIESNFAYYPIDIIELRYFLENDSLSFGCPNVLFSHKFVKRYCLGYPLILCVDIKGLENDQKCGFFIDYTNLSLKKRLKRLFMSSKLDKEKTDNINKIIEDTGTNVDLAIDFRENDNIAVAESDGIIKVAQNQIQERNVQLNPFEENLFKTLIDVKNTIRGLENVDMRVVGGWTRDKVMGKNSDDIDIAVSYKNGSLEANSGKYMSGIEFAKAVGEYAKMNNIPNVGEPYSVSLEKSADPKDKDKAIEELKVGGIDIQGMKLEFVGLRTEKYDEQSRKPEIFPTNSIEDDVIRRDLTINSLYYNIELGRIEDYVGGVNDIGNKILKTPTEPEKTFTEDPLRMLRVLRFASKLPDFKIDDKIIEVMRQSDDPNSPFAKSYKEKIAASRASKEIRKMMEGKSPIESAKLMLETGFYKLVFEIPTEWQGISMDQQSPFHNLTLLEHTLETMRNLKDMSEKMGVSDEERGLVLLAGLAHDFGKMHPEIAKYKIDKATGKPVVFDRNGQPVERKMYVGHEVASADFIAEILKKMNFTEEERKFVTLLVRKHMAPHDIAKAIQEYENAQENAKPKRLTTLQKSVGKYLQSIDSKIDEINQAVSNIKKDKRISENERVQRVKELERWIPIFERAWQQIINHGVADDLAKGNLTQEEIKEIRDIQSKLMQFVTSYRDTMGELTRKPVSGPQIAPGEMVRNIMKKEIPNFPDNGMISGIHYIRYILDKVIEQQHIGTIKTVDQMEQFIRKNAKAWYKLVLENAKQQTKKTFNLSQMTKKADASSSEDPAGFDGYEDKSPLRRIEDTVRFIDYHGVPTPFQVGDEVVLRFGGLGRGKMKGVVKSISQNGDYVVEWQNGEWKGKKERISQDKATIKLDKA